MRDSPVLHLVVSSMIPTHVYLHDFCSAHTHKLAVQTMCHKHAHGCGHAHPHPSHAQHTQIHTQIPYPRHPQANHLQGDGCTETGNNDVNNWCRYTVLCQASDLQRPAIPKQLSFSTNMSGQCSDEADSEIEAASLNPTALVAGSFLLISSHTSITDTTSPHPVDAQANATRKMGGESTNMFENMSDSLGPKISPFIMISRLRNELAHEL